MASRPTLWLDLRRDLAAARDAARRAELALAALPDLDDARLREASELGVSKHVHDAYSAVEAALDRIGRAFEGPAPPGPRWHLDLLPRMAAPVDGLRPAVLTRGTVAALRELLGFRHVFRSVYEGLDFARVVPLVALAASTTGPASREIEAFCRAAGVAPPGAEGFGA